MAAGTDYYNAYLNVWMKPVWSGKPNATTFWGVMGTALDAQLDQLLQARAVRYPVTPPIQTFAQYSCPTDALQYLSAERGLEQVPTESETQWRARLQAAWRIWREAGSQQGHIDEFGWYGLLSVKVFRRKDLSTPPAVGSTYVQSFAKMVWSQFDVLINRPHPWTERVWGSPPAWGSGTWGSNMTASDVAYFKRQMREFKSGHDTGTYLYVSFNPGRIWGANQWGVGTWGGSGNTMAIVVGESHWAQRGLL